MMVFICVQKKKRDDSEEGEEEEAPKKKSKEVRGAGELSQHFAPSSGEPTRSVASNVDSRGK